MGSKMNSLLFLGLCVYGTHGQTTDDIWSDDETIVYGSSTNAPASSAECTVNGLDGACVESNLYCKTPNSGEGRVTWRTVRPCKTGVCCKLSDVVSTTVAPIGPTTENPGPTTGTPIPTLPTVPTVPTSSSSTPVACGIRNENGIFYRGGTNGDKEAKFGEFPWTVAIYKVDNGQERYTGVGSLIHPRVVLTSANRFDRGGKFKVRAGDWNLPTEDEWFLHEVREVTSAVIHERFSSGSGANNIGLLFLDRDIQRDMHINFACLPDSNVVTQPSTVCLMSGWGMDKVGGSMQDTQKYVELPIVDHDTCQTKIRGGLRNQRYKLHTSMLCAGGNGQDACQGDGGAPLVCPYPGQTKRYYQAGIVSWGIACRVQDLPGVYSDVANLRAWIDEKVIAAGYTTNYYTS